jgi:hypothetical protein
MDESMPEANSVEAMEAKCATVEPEGAMSEVAVAKTSTVIPRRRTQCRAGCGNHRGDQTNRYLAHHDASPFC